MNLTNILPRPLEPSSGTDCVSLLGSVFTTAYFERPQARALGWRGIRPSAAEAPAWTCRVAGSPFVYGLCFEGEEYDADALCLRGVFSLYAFPANPDDPVLDRYPLRALQTALSGSYENFVREFTADANASAAFICGRLRLDAALDGTSLALVLEAPARRQIVSLDGCKTENGWLVEPGAAETDLPEFAMLLRLFTTLAATFEQQLGTPPELFMGRSEGPSPAYDAQGRIHFLEDRPEHALSFSCIFGGTNLSLPGERARLVPRLPLRHMPELLEASGRPLLHILTGFLGSGKTTFLRGWLDYLHGRERYTGVIQNEFGSVDLDAALLGDDTRVEALNDGCVCCTLADSLRPGLERLMADMPAETFILETSGLANPANVFDALHELRDLVTPGLVITVVDSLDLKRNGDGAGLPEQQGVRRAQIEKADVLILNKIDTVDENGLAGLQHRLHSLNPKALILHAGWGQVPYAELDAFMDAHPGCAPLPSHRPTLLPLGANAQTHTDEGFSSFTLELLEALSRGAVAALLAECGAGLCRAKGVLRLEGEGLKVVQYASGELQFSPAPAAPVDTPYLVLIGQNLSIPSVSPQKQG